MRTFEYICTHEQQSNYGYSCYTIESSNKEPYRVSDFIEYVLAQKHDFGHISFRFMTNDFCDPLIVAELEYRYGKFLNDDADKIFDQLKDKQINDVKCYGSWTANDYVIYLKASPIN